MVPVSTHLHIYSLLDIFTKPLSFQIDTITDEFLYLSPQIVLASPSISPKKENQPAQHRVLSTLRCTIIDIRPSLQKLLMQHHPRQLASDGAVDVFDDGEICWEEDVEIALLDLRWRI